MKERWNEFWYEWVSHNSYGGGGYRKFRKQRFINVTSIVIITILFLITNL